MPEKLIMNDGTELYGWAEEYKAGLAVYVHGKTMAEMFELLNNESKTAKIISERNDGTHTYEGYTNLKEIAQAGSSLIAATMTKE